MSIRGFVCMLAVAGTSLTAAAPQRPAQPGPTFRVEVNYVEIDAIVTDDKGAFVRGLTRDDFELVEEGRPQSIGTFTVVDVPVRRPDPLLFNGRVSIEPDVASNDSEFNGRVIVLLLDDVLTDARRSIKVRAAAKQFVLRFVNDNDLVAVVHSSAGGATSQNFTNNRQRLLASIDKFVGQRIQSAAAARLEAFQRSGAAGVTQDPAGVQDPDVLERASRSRAAMDRLRGAAEFLGNIRGRRKALLWFSEGIDGNIQDPMNTHMTAVRESMREMVGAAQRAGVSFYAIDPRGVGAGMDDALMMGSSVDDPTGQLGMADLMRETALAQLTLRSISDETGGFAVLGGMDINQQFAKIVEENSSYYLLGYYPTDEKRDGKFRKVEVRVKRPGLRVRHRTGYAAPKGKAPARAATSPASAPPELRAALENPLPMAGLPMRFFAAPFAGPGNKAAVLIAIEVDPAALRFEQANGTFNEDLEFIIVPINASGKPLDGARDQAPLRLSAPSHDRIRTQGFRTVRRLDLPPGRYELRVAAKSSNANRVGALSYNLDVPDFSKAPLSMSGITLMSPSADRVPTAPPSKEFMDVLPMAMTAIREFPRADTLFLFADVYTRQAGTPHAVEIATTIRRDDGTTVFSNRDERRTEELKGKSGGFGHSLKVPLSSMAPGRYVLRIEARALISNGAATTRELEFQVR